MSLAVSVGRIARLSGRLGKDRSARQSRHSGVRAEHALPPEADLASGLDLRPRRRNVVVCRTTGREGLSGMFNGVAATTKVGRNDPCLCGSGRKYKQCCQPKGGDTAFLAQSVQFSPPPTDKGRLKILFSSAMAHLNARQWPEAVRELRELTQLDPSNADAHYKLGAAELHLGRLPYAIVSLRRTVELRPNFEPALAGARRTCDHHRTARHMAGRSQGRAG